MSTTTIFGVREELPDRARELEPVSRAGAREEHLRVAGMPVDPEVLVRGVRVKAHGRLDERPVGRGHVGPEPTPQLLDLVEELVGWFEPRGAARWITPIEVRPRR